MRDLTNAELEGRICSKIAFYSFVLIGFTASHTALKVVSLLVAFILFVLGEFIRYEQDKARREN